MCPNSSSYPGSSIQITHPHQGLSSTVILLPTDAPGRGFNVPCLKAIPFLYPWLNIAALFFSPWQPREILQWTLQEEEDQKLGGQAATLKEVQGHSYCPGF